MGVARPEFEYKVLNAGDVYHELRAYEACVAASADFIGVRNRTPWQEPGAGRISDRL